MAEVGLGQLQKLLESLPPSPTETYITGFFFFNEVLISNSNISFYTQILYHNTIQRYTSLTFTL